MTYAELTALVDGLMSDHTSHTFASAAEWAYVPSPQEVAFYDELDVKLAMNRGKNSPMPQPVKRPWVSSNQRAIRPRNDAASRDRRQKLNEWLGL